MIPMLQINKKPTFVDRLNAGVSQGVQHLADYQSIARENEAIKKRTGLDLAGIQDPATRQQLLANELKYEMARKKAQADQNANLTSDQTTQQGQMQPQQEVKNTPSLKGAKAREKAPFKSTLLPQQQTTGELRPVLNPLELNEEAKRLQRYYNEQNIPMQLEEARQMVKDINEDNKLYNYETKLENRDLTEYKEKYGALGKEKILNYMADATPDIQEYFAKRGEEIAEEKNLSPADAEKRLTKEVIKFKNDIENIKSHLPARRAYNNIQSDLLGTSVKAETERASLRADLKPILEKGFYGLARTLLEDRGYYPEERETILSSLGETASKQVAQLPEMKKTLFLSNPKSSYTPYEERYTPQQEQQIRKTIRDTLKADPATNLLLFRKALEDKNVDHEIFLDEISKMEYEGEFEYNEEQQTVKDLLKQPPLDRLQKILYGLNLRGR